MRYKIFTLALSILIFITIISPVNAQSPTTSESINEKLNSQINNLKDKIASRVTELDLVEKRGITGVVMEASNSQITLKDIKGNTRIIDIDEITKFSSSLTSDNFGVSDLVEGDKLNVLGLYNKESKRLLARFVSTAVNPSIVSGGISNIDDDDFIINILSSNGESVNINIVSSTKTNEYDKEKDLTKSGFSKLKIEDRVIAIGLPDKNNPKTIIAKRLLVFPTLPKNPGINITKKEPAPTETE